MNFLNTQLSPASLSVPLLQHSFVSLRNREMCYKLLETVCSHAQVVDPPTRVAKWRDHLSNSRSRFELLFLCVCLSGTGREQPSSLLRGERGRSRPGRLFFFYGFAHRSQPKQESQSCCSGGDDKRRVMHKRQTLTWSASLSAGLELFQFGGQRRSRSEPTEQHLSR